MFNTKLKINNASDESTISYFPFISVSRCLLFFFYTGYDGIRI